MGNEGKRSRLLVVRMSDAELEELDRSAGSAGVGRSAYVRALVAGEGVEVLKLDCDHDDVRLLLLELKRQGNNLNQVAHRMNAGASVPPGEVSDALDSCRRATDEVSRVLEMARPHRC